MDAELILVAEGLYLYALTPHGHLLWEWELPHRHENTWLLSPGATRLVQ